MLLAIQTHRGCAFDLCGLRTRLVGGAVGEHVWKSLRAVFVPNIWEDRHRVASELMIAWVSACQHCCIA